jgi:hypothetical protein
VLSEVDGQDGMSIKDALHELVDRLGEDEAAEVYSFARLIAAENGDSLDRERQRHGIVVSGREFFSAPPKDAATLAREQGVGPIRDFDALRADFWPEDESADEFVETIRRWRREGG